MTFAAIVKIGDKASKCNISALIGSFVGQVNEQAGI